MMQIALSPLSRSPVISAAPPFRPGAATRRLIDGEHPLRIANDLRLEARRVYARLDNGLQGYGG